MKKNGSIELLRFIFCFIIIIHHVSIDVFGINFTDTTWKGFFRYGGLGVEFFFMVSGYFFAHSLSKALFKKFDISDAWKFIWKKTKSILPYHIIVNLLVLVGKIVYHHPAEELINQLSSILFLPVLGFNNHEWLLGSEWYVGYMLFTMLVIYPFLRIFFDCLVYYVSPILSFILLGYLSCSYGRVMGSDRMIRSFEGILFGIAAYGIGKKIRWKSLNKLCRKMIELYPTVTIILYLVYMNSTLEITIQPIMVVLLWSSMIVVFSEQSFFANKHLLDNKIVYWLGHASMPIYMVQNFTRSLSRKILVNYGTLVVYCGEVLFTFVVGIMMMLFINIIVNRGKLRIYQLQK